MHREPSQTSIRIALVEDHELVARGFTNLLESTPVIDVVATAASVNDLVDELPRLNLVVLDLRLADGSSAIENIRQIQDAGVGVLVLTAAEDAALIRSAARAGALGIVQKSQPASELIDAILSAANGEVVPSLDWAAAIDGDVHLADARLSPREKQILALYASGEKAQSVAYLTSLSASTVTNYVSRIRTKYADVGRAANTKVDLHRRAREDGLLPTDQS